MTFIAQEVFFFAAFVVSLLTGIFDTYLIYFFCFIQQSQTSLDTYQLVWFFIRLAFTMLDVFTMGIGKSTQNNNMLIRGVFRWGFDLIANQSVPFGCYLTSISTNIFPTLTFLLRRLGRQYIQVESAPKKRNFLVNKYLKVTNKRHLKIIACSAEKFVKIGSYIVRGALGKSGRL